MTPHLLPQHHGKRIAAAVATLFLPGACAAVGPDYQPRDYRANDLFDRTSRTWSTGPSISWKIFEAGAVRRSIQIQTAAQEQSLAAWEAAVLAALEETENVLSAYAEEQVRLERLAAADLINLYKALGGGWQPPAPSCPPGS